MLYADDESIGEKISIEDTFMTPEARALAKGEILRIAQIIAQLTPNHSPEYRLIFQTVPETQFVRYIPYSGKKMVVKLPMQPGAPFLSPRTLYEVTDAILRLRTCKNALAVRESPGAPAWVIRAIIYRFWLTHAHVIPLQMFQAEAGTLYVPFNSSVIEHKLGMQNYVYPRVAQMVFHDFPLLTPSEICADPHISKGLELDMFDAEMASLLLAYLEQGLSLHFEPNFVEMCQKVILRKATDEEAYYQLPFPAETIPFYDFVTHYPLVKKGFISAVETRRRYFWEIREKIHTEVRVPISQENDSFRVDSVIFSLTELPQYYLKIQNPDAFRTRLSVEIYNLSFQSPVSLRIPLNDIAATIKNLNIQNIDLFKTSLLKLERHLTDALTREEAIQTYLDSCAQKYADPHKCIRPSTRLEEDLFRESQRRNDAMKHWLDRIEKNYKILE